MKCSYVQREGVLDSVSPNGGGVCPQRDGVCPNGTVCSGLVWSGQVWSNGSLAVYV